METPLTSAAQRRRHFNAAALLVVALLCLATPVARAAGTIAGPSLTNLTGGWTYTGIAFTALDDSTLTSFTFQSQGKPDTVVLADLTNGAGNHSVSTAGGTVSVSWALTAGHQYQLLQTTMNNSMWANWNQPGPSDADIQITVTGCFSNTYGCGTSVCGFCGPTSYWAAFNNITTGPPSASQVTITTVKMFDSHTVQVDVTGQFSQDATTQKSLQVSTTLSGVPLTSTFPLPS
jgi:hypothetical protein